MLPRSRRNSNAGEITEEQVDAAKHRIFTIEAAPEMEDADALGVMVSQYLEWDGGAVIRAFSSALEDSNFHTENAKIRKMFKWAFEEE